MNLLAQLAQLSKIVTMNEQETMSFEETRAALGLSVRTLRRRVASGEIKPLPKPPLLKQAAKLRFPRSEIEKLLAPRE